MTTVVDPIGTPLLQQYREIKGRHRDAILFFRMGDFYEMFFEDAELGARVLGITLTSRGDGVPLAGVPVKAAADTSASSSPPATGSPSASKWKIPGRRAAWSAVR